jgi:protocatechuate 3,4-dioxygenase beta subunit
MVLHGSYAPSTMSVRVEGAAAGATVVLEKGGKLRLQVVDWKGKRVERAVVEMWNAAGENVIEDLLLLQGDLRRTFVTQIDGYLVVDHAAPGAYRMAARKGDARSQEGRIAAVAGQTAEIKLTLSE